jgi:hypothetical protein
MFGNVTATGGCESEPKLAVPDGGGRYLSVVVVNQDHCRLLHGARTDVLSQAESTLSTWQSQPGYLSASIQDFESGLFFSAVTLLTL